MEKEERARSTEGVGTGWVGGREKGGDHLVPPTLTRGEGERQTLLDADSLS